MGIFDFDNDGWKDVFVAAGDVQDNTELMSSGKSRQQNLLLLNDGHGAFRGALTGSPAMHRGVAFGDFDSDGRVDAVVTRLTNLPSCCATSWARGTIGSPCNSLASRATGTPSGRV